LQCKNYTALHKKQELLSVIDMFPVHGGTAKIEEGFCIMGVVDFTNFVNELADLSGKTILPFFRTALATSNKAGGGGFDPVTEADRASELAMRRHIKEHFPLHGIIGEEYGSEGKDADYIWVLDPVDGTRAFIAGLPLWGTLIGLVHGGNPCFGMMNQPFIKERFWGDGEAAYYNGPTGERPLMTSRCQHVNDAILTATTPAMFQGKAWDAFQRLEMEARMTRYGADAYGYCMLAAGHIDVVVEADLQPYDIIPLIPIIEGAGGIVTTWQGDDPTKGGSIVAAATRQLHHEVLRILNI
jgi:histidinol phosphatase-like enzyme (inositol monophosphatase family)